jgi:RimJ/RimL family protein N-acetyltransferase
VPEEAFFMASGDMEETLVAIEFTEELLPHVQAFACGDESYERELADWIREHALAAIARGAKVWLYANQAKEVVGFGSVGVTRWKYPEGSRKRAALAVIPAVAIQKPFWGKPDGPPEGRYSTQILHHLLAEAARLPLDVPVIGLFVHPDNARAIKAYERAGFKRFPHAYTDPDTNVTYVSMVLPLPPAPVDPA